MLRKQLKMNMKDRSDKSRMQTLFTNHVSILRRNGLTWPLESNERVAVTHVLTAIRAKSLQSCLQSDLDFAHHHLRKKKAFLVHSIKISEAFEILESGFEADKHHGNNTTNNDNNSG